MKIIEGKTMTCKTCDTTFTYEENELVHLPGYACMCAISCPRCHQQIIMVADNYKEAPTRIVVEENNDEDNQKTS
jgi:hypothetical protein